MTRRLLVLSVSLVATTFGACNCDDDLYTFPGSLKGVVCSVDSGAGLSDVAITIVDADGTTHEATSGAGGIFNADKLSAGEAQITIHSTDGEERTATVDIEPRRESQFTDTTCHPPIPPEVPSGTIAGCVCDEAVGAWVQGANVFVINDAGSVFATGTDEVGCFTLPGVTVGAQTLKVEKGAFYEEYAVEVVNGDTVSIPSPSTCEPPPPPEGSGTVEGRVCAPDGQTWLSDATAYVEREDGTRAQDTTDADGRYTLTGVPAGDQVIVIQKGSFTTTIPVTVTEGQTTTIPEDQCQLLQPDLKIAVVLGQYDRVQDVLSDLGVDPANITTYDGAGFASQWVSDLVEDYAVLSQYDIVFFNCGVDDSDFMTPLLANQVAVANIRQFVQEGGSVYASDWAYSIVERAWQDKIDFYGNDAGLGASKHGVTTNAIQGTIADVALATSMGTSQIELHYPLVAWVPMQAVASDVTIYIQADAPVDNGPTLTNVPHTVGFNAGSGRVIYTSFHQEPGISPAQERVLQLLMFEL